MKKSNSSNDVRPENIRDLYEIFGGAREVACASWKLENGNEEQTLAGERLVKLDLSKLQLLELKLPRINFELLEYTLPEIHFHGSRKLPRGIVRNETSTMNSLPHVVQILIFMHLPVADLARCMRASKELNELLNLNDFWCVLLARDYNEIVGEYSLAKTNYKIKYYVDKALLRIPDYRIPQLRFNNLFDFVAQYQNPDVHNQPPVNINAELLDVMAPQRFFHHNPAQRVLMEAPHFQLHPLVQNDLERVGGDAVVRLQGLEEADAADVEQEDVRNSNHTTPAP